MNRRDLIKAAIGVPSLALAGSPAQARSLIATPPAAAPPPVRDAQKITWQFFDTCACVIGLAWDRTVPQDQREHDGCVVRTVCQGHAHVLDADDVRELEALLAYPTGREMRAHASDRAKNAARRVYALARNLNRAKNLGRLT